MTLGNDIEKRSGKLTLVGLFLVTAFISNWAQFLVVGPNFGGLSGVVWFARFLLDLQCNATSTTPLVSNSIVGFMLVWLILGFVDMLPVSMANWAHLAGLIAGMAYAMSDKLLSRK